MVESVRVGTLIAHDRKAANRWKAMKGRLTAASGGGGLTGEALERAVASLAVSHPEYVVMEQAGEVVYP
jgi:hypothetical protein